MSRIEPWTPGIWSGHTNCSVPQFPGLQNHNFFNAQLGVRIFNFHGLQKEHGWLIQKTSLQDRWPEFVSRMDIEFTLRHRFPSFFRMRSAFCWMGNISVGIAADYSRGRNSLDFHLHCPYFSDLIYNNYFTTFSDAFASFPNANWNTSACSVQLENWLTAFDYISYWILRIVHPFKF
jgi:hypothetical protein